MALSHRRYIALLLGSAAAVLLMILTLNLLMAWRALAPRNIVAASEWQQATGGLTSASLDGVNNRPFKVLRLADRLPEINTLILGSSTVMPITAAMFPAPFRAYNFSQNNNGLRSMIGEMEYVLDHAPDIRWMVMSVDWVTGALYQAGEPIPADLSVDSQRRALQSMSVDIMRRDVVLDAMTWPRAIGLLRTLRDIAGAAHPVAAFREQFWDAGSPPYPCGPALIARDFDQAWRGACMGFDADGSAAMRALPRLRQPIASPIPETPAIGHYRAMLRLTQGEPYMPSLARLAELSRTLERRGGRIVFLLPPMLNGLEGRAARRSAIRPGAGAD
jgi:hypothetical protein